MEARHFFVLFCFVSRRWQRKTECFCHSGRRSLASTLPIRGKKKQVGMDLLENSSCSTFHFGPVILPPFPESSGAQTQGKLLGASHYTVLGSPGTVFTGSPSRIKNRLPVQRLSMSQGCNPWICDKLFRTNDQFFQPIMTSKIKEKGVPSIDLKV